MVVNRWLKSEVTACRKKWNQMRTNYSSFSVRKERKKGRKKGKREKKKKKNHSSSMSEDQRNNLTP